MSNLTRCDGGSRRDLLRVGGLSALGLGLGDYFRLQRLSGAEGSLRAKAKACILVWLDGGPSHLETFDPKPEAPAEVRGPLKTVATKLPGVRFSEDLARTAGLLDKLAVIRSMTSTLGEHNFGTHYLMTGYKPTPVVEYPAFGATLAHVRGQAGVLPANIAVPDFGIGGSQLSGNGYLPGSTRPFSVGGSSGRRGFKVRDLDFYRGLDLARLDQRRKFVGALDEFSRTKDASSKSASDPDLERAYNLIASTEAKRAFDFSGEPEKVRALYGDQRNSIGQACLLARRLVERGVPFVTVNSKGWDTHQDLYSKLKERYPGDKWALLPSLDFALSGLVGDLSDRGMLDDTLVVVMGEFGRTPKLNANGGRDHWPRVFSVALAGGGVKGGQVIGQSDSLGESPKDRPVTPADLAATIYTLLGINPDLKLHTGDGRPVRVAPDGSKVVSELIA